MNNDDSSSSSSDEEMMIKVINAVAASVAAIANDSDQNDNVVNQYRGGPKVEKAANLELEVHLKNLQLDADFFCRYRDGPPLFTEE